MGARILDGKSLAADLRAEIAAAVADLRAATRPAARPGGFSGRAETPFGFIALRPPSLQPGVAMPHLRLDQVLEFLLGDKMQ